MIEAKLANTFNMIVLFKSPLYYKIICYYKAIYYNFVSKEQCNFAVFIKKKNYIWDYTAPTGDTIYMQTRTQHKTRKVCRV